MYEHLRNPSTPPSTFPLRETKVCITPSENGDTTIQTIRGFVVVYFFLSIMDCATFFCVNKFHGFGVNLFLLDGIQPYDKTSEL